MQRCRANLKCMPLDGMHLRYYLSCVNIRTDLASLSRHCPSCTRVLPRVARDSWCLSCLLLEAVFGNRAHEVSCCCIFGASLRDRPLMTSRKDRHASGTLTLVSDFWTLATALNIRASLYTIRWTDPVLILVSCFQHISFIYSHAMSDCVCLSLSYTTPEPPHRSNAFVGLALCYYVSVCCFWFPSQASPVGWHKRKSTLHPFHKKQRVLVICFGQLLLA